MDETAARPDPIQVQIEVWTLPDGRVDGVFGINRQPRSSAEAARLSAHLFGLLEGAQAIFQSHYLQEKMKAGNGKLAVPPTAPKLVV